MREENNSRAADASITLIRNGDRGEFNAHIDRWVYRIYDVALSILGSTAGAVEVSRDMIASLWDRHLELSADDLTRDSLLVATRERALSQATRNDRQEISTTNEHVVLARAASVVVGIDEVSALDLYLRHGVGADALGLMLGVASNAVPHRLALSRADLGEAMATFTLWNAGRPICVELVRILGDATEFDTIVAGSIELHRQDCPECARRHRSLVNPERLFIAAPIVAVSATLRERIIPIAATSTDPTGVGRAVHDSDSADDLDDPWAATIRSTPMAAVAVVQDRRSAQPQATALTAALVAVLIVGGVVALAARGSGGNEGRVSGASVPANQLVLADPAEEATTTTERPRARTTPSPSASTTSTSTSTSTSTTPLDPATTSVADVVLVGPPVPSTTARSRTVTTSSVSSSSPSTTLSSTMPTTTAPPTTIAPTTTGAATTTTTEAPTTPTTTAAPTTTEAPTTTTAPTPTEAPTTTTPP